MAFAKHLAYEVSKHDWGIAWGMAGQEEEERLVGEQLAAVFQQ